MRIRYIKPGGDGVEADLPDGAALRLIASGAAEAVQGEGPAKTSTERAGAQSERPAAKKTATRRRSR